MSRSEGASDPAPERAAFLRLEGAVGRLVDEMDRLRGRAQAAERRVVDLEELLRRFTKGAENPARLRDRVEELERENQDLRRRIAQGREGVERLQSRIRFLEEQR